MKKDTNVAGTINTDIKGVIGYWLKFTKPIHKMTSQEQQILSSFLYYYLKFRNDLKEESITWKMTFDYETRLKVKLDTGVKDYTLQNILTRLRKKNIITRDNKIRKAYIPNINIDSKKFQLVYNFNINE